MTCCVPGHISDAMSTNDKEQWIITTSFFQIKHQFHTHVIILNFNSFFPTSATLSPIQFQYTCGRKICHPSFSLHTSLPSPIYIFIPLTLLLFITICNYNTSNIILTHHSSPKLRSTLLSTTSHTSYAYSSSPLYIRLFHMKPWIVLTGFIINN